MLFHNSKDESAWGLALVGLIVVTMAIFLGEVTGNVQPKAPMESSHPDVASPYLKQGVTPESGHPKNGSPYPEPIPGNK